MSSPDGLKAQLDIALKRTTWSTAELKQLIESDLHRNSSRFAGRTLEEMIGKLVAAAELENWDHALLDASMRHFAKRNRSGIDREIDGSSYTQPGVGRRYPLPPGSRLLEDAWNGQRTRIERRVCRIVRKDPDGYKTLGTGFLIGPSLVLTNWHVLYYLLAGILRSPGRVLFQFDYLEKDAAGRLCGLADDWFVACNPARDAPRVRDNDLDYAVVRLADEPGDDQIEGARRGHISVPPPVTQGERRFTVDEPIYVVQHPGGNPLRLATNSRGVKEVRERARVTYRVTTDEGSSGSPCFNKDWTLVALHRGGAPETDANEGVPIDSIRDDLPEDVRTEITRVA
ncbi:trypsin-like serine peptidase [Sorangium sp. So ce1153]|uniref:trypsin-like serine peptidase n=1 Tax=Sorangium sp. So ce1153 TaxID=3133333 RepID=UPI003F62B364